MTSAVNVSPPLPLPLALAVAFVFNVLSPSASLSTFKTPRLVCSSLRFICNTTRLDIQDGWRWCVSSYVLRDGSLTFLYRLAFPLRRAHGSRVIVHHGFLRASFFSQFVKLIVFLLRQIIMFSDLECDYINPIDLCNKLNQVRLFCFCFLFGLLTWMADPGVSWL